MFLALTVAAALAATPVPELAPGAKYDPKIPTLKQVLGHEPGEVITPPEAIAIYLRALNQAAPERTQLVEYARTWEGRPLWLFVVAPLLGAAAAALLYRTIRALDPVLQMPQRQAMQALLGETAQRMDRAGAKPSEF